jgi:hypothetical protein
MHERCTRWELTNGRMHARQRLDPEVQRYWEGVLESVTKPTARAMLKELDTGRLLGLPVGKRMLTTRDGSISCRNACGLQQACLTQACKPG